VTVEFPAELNARIDAKKFDQTQKNPAMVHEMEGGYVVTRPRYHRRPRRVFSIGFTNLSDDDKQTLEDFWNTVKGSALGFNVTLPITDEVVLVRFTQDTNMSFKYIGPVLLDDGSHGGRWDVDSLKVEEV
jgi:hypothetical protein